MDMKNLPFRDWRSTYRGKKKNSNIRRFMPVKLSVMTLRESWLFEE